MNAARYDEYRSDSVLFLALELSAGTWKVGTTVGMGQKPREQNVDAGDLETLWEEIGKAKVRFGLPAEARVIRRQGDRFTDEVYLTLSWPNNTSVLGFWPINSFCGRITRRV